MAWFAESLYARPSASVYVASKVDALSHILALLRPIEVGWRLVEGHGGWTLHYPPRRDIVVFGHLLEGGCEVWREGVRLDELDVGDFMLMASPRPWFMRSPGGGPEVGLKTLIADPTLLRREGGSGRVTRFVGGYFAFDSVGADLIGQLLPPMVHVDLKAKAAGRLGTLLEMLGEEVQAQRAGRTHVLDRLLELMLVETLRQPGQGWDEAQSNLLRGLSDPRVARALERLHADVSRGWTVADLAEVAGMSRSAFALRFHQLVGLSPIAYLSNWRMALARAALAKRAQPIGAIAAEAGFQSVSAFSTAFRRTTGTSPALYARTLPPMVPDLQGRRAQ